MLVWRTGVAGSKRYTDLHDGAVGSRLISLLLARWRPHNVRDCRSYKNKTHSIISLYLIGNIADLMLYEKETKIANLKS